MKVCLITATRDRHRQIERVVKFVLNQTDDRYVHLIYNNSPISQRLNDNLPEDKFILVNNNIKLGTLVPYSNLGDIYSDILKFIPEDCDVVNFMDDDDIFLPNHVEEGLKGMEKGGLKAYKPQKSWFRYLKEYNLAENTLEPSIFVKTEHIKEHRFSPETSAQHLKWVNPLILEHQIFVDPQGIPTYICDWSQEISTFKTSGDPNNPQNFNNFINYTKDSGDGVITPCSQSWAEHYYRIKTNDLHNSTTV